MKKRFVSLFMAVIIAIGAVAACAVSASAEEARLKTSAECVEILKAEEGFCLKPYWDYAQYTVGYGTKCPDEMVDYYKANGISKADAEALLYNYLNAFENALYTYLIDKYDITLNQHQFDALIMFSYNVGTGWLYKQQDNLRDAIVAGATGNEMIDRFSRWCNAGGQILKPLLRRRLCEANMYLNGVYSREAPDHYAYVLYDPAGGVTDPNVQGYDASLTAQIIPTPTYEGYTFDGWYTQRIGGTKVTVLDETTKNARLYAHWVDGEGKAPSEGDESDGVSVNITANELNVRKGPGTNYEAAGQLNKGDKVVITETAPNGSYTWGKFYGGWIRLDYTDYQVSEQEEEKPAEPAVTVTGTVKVSDFLRVRSGPGTGYAMVGTLTNGTKVEILEQKIAGAMTWGKIEKGWISLDYVILDKEETTPEATEPTEPEATEPAPTEPEVTEPAPTEPKPTEPPVEEPKEEKPAAQTGTVKVNDFLRIRAGAGTSYGIAGYLSPNERVTITETKQVGGITWGKIDKGWVSLDYIVLDKQTSGSADTGVKEETPSETVTGTVQVNDFLRVRSGPSTSYAVAGYLSAGEKVEILEQKTVGGMKWGRISKGWISMDYIKLNTAASAPAQPAPEQNQPQTVTKTVIADCLRIRSEAGTGYAVVGYLYNGSKVEILETKVVNGVTWGRVSKGWISMDYVK